ncbi:MAG: helix-turn-helix domain-containing protein [Yaniella sp.]|nr:helix-turn-helix domain-containing protein [Yaniella sp.]MDN6498175.1 helix-turn-helix domain-containing protein [Yaniella sp.]
MSIKRDYEPAIGETQQWFSVAEVSRHVGVNESTVRRAIQRGDLPARRVGLRLLRIRREDLMAWLGQEDDAA